MREEGNKHEETEGEKEIKKNDDQGKRRKNEKIKGRKTKRD